LNLNKEIELEGKDPMEEEMLELVEEVSTLGVENISQFWNL
jgi:hypothetical protein